MRVTGGGGGRGRARPRPQWPVRLLPVMPLCLSPEASGSMTDTDQCAHPTMSSTVPALPQMSSTSCDHDKGEETLQVRPDPPPTAGHFLLVPGLSRAPVPDWRDGVRSPHLPWHRPPLPLEKPPPSLCFREARVAVAGSSARLRSGGFGSRGFVSSFLNSAPRD